MKRGMRGTEGRGEKERRENVEERGEESRVKCRGSKKGEKRRF